MARHLSAGSAGDGCERRATGLELKVPPPVVAAVAAAAMWLLARVVPPIALPTWLRIGLTFAMACAGGALGVWAIGGFLRARTTIEPMTPHKTSRLVTGGPYHLTRNPMYVAIVVVLTAFAVWLAEPVALLAIAGFVAYVDRFQIRPEERILACLFEDEYEEYLTRTRRWV